MQHLIAIHEKFAARKDFLIIGINRDFELATVAEYLKNSP
jgi:hypothetical protein